MKTFRASIFRYQPYLEQMYEYTSLVEQGEYEALRNRVRAIINRLSLEWPVVNNDFSIETEQVISSSNESGWTLSHHHAGPLPDLKWLDKPSQPGNSELGQYFLICASDFLTPCPSTMEEHWKIFYDVLYRIGWSQAECDLLIKGRPTSFLLKPLEGRESPWPIRESDPYWLWLHPIRSRAGWLTYTDASDYLSRLQLMEKQFTNFNFRKLFDQSVDPSGLFIEQRKNLISAYTAIIKILSGAVQDHQGLFTSISLV